MLCFHLYAEYIMILFTVYNYFSADKNEKVK